MVRWREVGGRTREAEFYDGFPKKLAVALETAFLLGPQRLLWHQATGWSHCILLYCDLSIFLWHCDVSMSLGWILHFSFVGGCAYMCRWVCIYVLYIYVHAEASSWYLGLLLKCFPPYVFQTGPLAELTNLTKQAVQRDPGGPLTLPYQRYV